MGKFVVIVHPQEISDAFGNFPAARYLPVSAAERLLKIIPAYRHSAIGVQSAYGKAEGWFVMVPLTARQINSLPMEYIIGRIIQAGRLAEKIGASIVGLGPFSPVLGDAAAIVGDNLKAAVVTGHRYILAAALQGVGEAAKLAGYDLKKIEIVILGADSIIGNTFSLLLARQAGKMTLVAGDAGKLKNLAGRILFDCGLSVVITSNVRKAIQTARMIIAVDSPAGIIIDPEDILPGAVVWDLIGQHKISRLVGSVRGDVLVVEECVIKMAGNAVLDFNPAFSPFLTCPGAAETMIMAIEDCCPVYSPDRQVTVGQVEEISALSGKHGFKLAGFRNCERILAVSN